MNPKDVHLADRVSKPELLRGGIFLFITIVAVFSFGGSGVLRSSAEHLQIVKASCSRKIIFAAAGLCMLCSCKKNLLWRGS